MISTVFIGLFFALIKPDVLFLFQYQSYLNIGRLDIRNADENGSDPNKQIAPRGFTSLFSSFHIGSNGMTESHLHAVIPYGKSVMQQSKRKSSSGMISRQSP